MDVPSTRHAHFEASKAEQRRKQSRQGRWAGRVRQGKQDGQSRQGLQSRQTAQAEQAGRASDARTSLRQGKQDGQSRQCLQSRQTAQAGQAGRASDARTLLATFLFVPNGRSGPGIQRIAGDAQLSFVDTHGQGSFDLA